MGTIRSDRTNGKFPLEGIPTGDRFTAKVPKGTPRGLMLWRWQTFKDAALTIVKWNDSKAFYVISSAHTPGATVPVSRLVKHVRTLVPCPESVADYNKYMGGVDKQDQMTATYRADKRSVKWWRKVATWILETAVFNAYIAYKIEMGNDNPHKTYKSFFAALAYEMLMMNDNPRGAAPYKRPRASSGEPATAKAAAAIGALPEDRYPTNGLHAFAKKVYAKDAAKDNRQRCIICDTKTEWACEGCGEAVEKPAGAPMCYPECFIAAHSERRRR